MFKKRKRIKEKSNLKANTKKAKAKKAKEIKKKTY
jgi:hypothetical protein